MKKIISGLLAFILLAFMLCSCVNGGGGGEDTTDQSSVGVYAGLVDLLRAELEQLKKDQDSDNTKYQDKIKELEDKLALLEAAQSDTQTQKPVDTETPTENDIPLTYEQVGGKITVTGLKDDSIEVLVIPEKIDGKPVTAIADSAFAGSDLTGVSLPSGVTDIGWFAFSGCVSLMNVSIPESVTVIGYDAFANCPKLTVYCASGSYAERYAESYGLAVVAS